MALTHFWIKNHCRKIIANVDFEREPNSPNIVILLVEDVQYSKIGWPLVVNKVPSTLKDLVIVDF